MNAAQAEERFRAVKIAVNVFIKKLESKRDKPVKVCDCEPFQSCEKCVKTSLKY